MTKPADSNANRLSPHFSYRELVRTDVRSLQQRNYSLGFAVRPKLEELCTTLLEPIRVAFDAPLIVHSGYRCPELNAAIGGSARSQHMKAEAADFHVSGHKLKTVFDWIVWSSPLLFGQLILEGYVADEPSWIHLSMGAPYRPRNRCGQVMTWNKKDGYRLIARKTEAGVQRID